MRVGGQETSKLWGFAREEDHLPDHTINLGRKQRNRITTAADETLVKHVWQYTDNSGNADRNVNNLIAEAYNRPKATAMATNKQQRPRSVYNDVTLGIYNNNLLEVDGTTQQHLSRPRWRKSIRMIVEAAKMTLN